MKKVITLIMAVWLSFNVSAQAPQKMSYQAVIRNSSNALVVSAAVSMRISILQNSSTGTVVYKETHTPTTNANGLVSIEIGTGTVVSGTFAGINWASGTYFIKTETDPAGGTNYTISGTSQMLSVPYALYAATSGSSTPGPQGVAGPQGPIGPQGATGASSPGNKPGQTSFWNGTNWVLVPPGTAGQTLSFCDGMPTWGPCPPPTPSVTNATTGKIWMDRNLGASQVATSTSDALSYGDLYQWGRSADGHQIRTSITTTTLSTSTSGGNGKFIVSTISPYDWLTTANTNLWQGVNGINNPCPTGYRIPTEAEFNAEKLSWITGNAAGAFGSVLKLPQGGYRRSDTGGLLNVGSFGGYWSSTIETTNSRHLDFGASFVSVNGGYRSAAFSVRCIRD